MDIMKLVVAFRILTHLKIFGSNLTGETVGLIARINIVNVFREIIDIYCGSEAVGSG
jgi:hypothetical protein